MRVFVYGVARTAMRRGLGVGYVAYLGLTAQANLFRPAASGDGIINLICRNSCGWRKPLILHNRFNEWA
jgi:hypothetical protein